MTEDYVRRTLPTKWAVDLAKLEERNITDLISKCGDICFKDFSNMKFNVEEKSCLNNCLYKGILMMSYFSHEYSDMMITKARKYEMRADE